MLQDIIQELRIKSLYTEAKIVHAIMVDNNKKKGHTIITKTIKIPHTLQLEERDFVAPGGKKWLNTRGLDKKILTMDLSTIVKKIEEKFGDLVTIDPSEKSLTFIVNNPKMV